MRLRGYNSDHFISFAYILLSYVVSCPLLFSPYSDRKRNFMIVTAAATKIQTRTRGWLSRTRIRAKYQKLVRMREKRRIRRRYRAAVRIQSVARMYLTRHVVERRKALVAAERRRVEEMRRFEERVADFHEGFLKDLLAIRVQNNLRERLARR